MKINPLLRAATLAAILSGAPALRAQFAPEDIQDAVDASFGPWDLTNVDQRGQVYSNIWSNQGAVSLDGIDAAQMSAVGSQYLSEYQVRTTVVGPTTLYFSYLGGVPYGGFGSVSVQGSALPAVRFWQEGSIPVGAGSQVVKWGFSTYAIPPAFLDQVWTADDPRPRVTSGSFVEGQKGLALTYQTTTNKPCQAFAATGLPPGMTMDPGTGLISGTPTELGSFDSRVKATNAGGSHVKSVVFRILAPSAASMVELAAAMDGPGPQWSQQAGTNTTAWSGSLTGLARDGVDAVTFPFRIRPQTPQPPTDSHWLKVGLHGPGTFSFWHRVVWFSNGTGETLTSSFSSVKARVNGMARSINPTPPPIGSAWQQWSLVLPSGIHQLEFAVSLHPDSFSWAAPNDALVLFDGASFLSEPFFFTYDEWQGFAGNFGGSDDAEGDRLGLLMEYALGGSPGLNDAALLPDVAIVDGHLTMTVHKAPGTLGLEWTVQANKSLAINGWTTFGTEIMDEGPAILVVRCKKSVDQEPSCMLRLRVRLNP